MSKGMKYFIGKRVPTEERLAALELLREMFYGRERVRGRMERILSVHQFGDNDD
jgi:hypothetical protein